MQYVHCLACLQMQKAGEGAIVEVDRFGWRPLPTSEYHMFSALCISGQASSSTTAKGLFVRCATMLLEVKGARGAITEINSILARLWVTLPHYLHY